jgi:hypothetical protein
MSQGREWSVTRARAVAQAALASGAVPGDRSGLELIRLGTNGVFRSGLTVIRVSPPGTDLGLVQQQLDLARWLVDRGFPTAAPMSERPVVVDGQVVTAWKLVGVTGEVADSIELGRLLRRFHLLTDDYDGALSPWEPLGRLGTRLVEAPIDEAFTLQDRQLLCTCRDDLTSAAQATRWELGQGPIHGTCTAETWW